MRFLASDLSSDSPKLGFVKRLRRTCFLTFYRGTSITKSIRGVVSAPKVLPLDKHSQNAHASNPNEVLKVETFVRINERPYALGLLSALNSSQDPHTELANSQRLMNNRSVFVLPNLFLFPTPSPKLLMCIVDPMIRRPPSPCHYQVLNQSGHRDWIAKSLIPSPHFAGTFHPRRTLLDSMHRVGDDSYLGERKRRDCFCSAGDIRGLGDCEPFYRVHCM